MCFRKASGHRVRRDDRLKGPEQPTRPIDQNRRAFGSLIEKLRDPRRDASGGHTNTLSHTHTHTQGSRNRSKENIHTTRNSAQGEPDRKEP